MWKMTSYKCKLKISRLEREAYLSRTENNTFALKSSMNTKQGVGFEGLKDDWHNRDGAVLDKKTLVLRRI